MLSGDRRSGEMHEGLKGLLGLTLTFEALYRPYPMRKYSIGINMAWGCSSVTIVPHSWTYKSQKVGNISDFNQIIFKESTRLCPEKREPLQTSTNALYLLSIFEVMWTASEWNGECSPTKIRERHCNFLNPSLKSGLLQDNTTTSGPIKMTMEEFSSNFIEIEVISAFSQCNQISRQCLRYNKLNFFFRVNIVSKCLFSSQTIR